MKHERTYIGIGMLDQYKCSCGWKGNPFFDHEEGARQEHDKHVNKELKNGKNPKRRV